MTDATTDDAVQPENFAGLSMLFRLRDRKATQRFESALTALTHAVECLTAGTRPGATVRRYDTAAGITALAARVEAAAVEAALSHDVATDLQTTIDEVCDDRDRRAAGLPRVDPLRLVAIVATLNDYDGPDVWADLITRLPEWSEHRTASAGGGKRVIVLHDGTVIRATETSPGVLTWAVTALG